MRKALIMAAVLAALGLGVAAPAGAKPAAAAKPSSAQVLGVVRLDRGDHRVAYIHAKYRCYGEGALWVSVKQVADRSADPRLAEEGSSAISAAWSDSHRNPVTCDGKLHNETFVVDQLEPYFTDEGPQGPKSEFFGPLAKGEGWVQFCLFDANNTEVPVTSQGFLHVR